MNLTAIHKWVLDTCVNRYLLVVIKVKSLSDVLLNQYTSPLFKILWVLTVIIWLFSLW